ncbi:hypothetical protein [Variovorax sp. LT1R16]|uniref:hypothetical protein n=1 Tax=Variovorax sp. LT1R16 TaxID=3443728 RepID=UPI003F48121C
MTLNTHPRSLRTLLAIGAIGCLSGCDLGLFESKSSDPLLSKEAIATRAAPQQLIFEGRLGGESMFLLVHDCEVYRVERREGGGVQWTSVLAPDFYPFWTVCERQSLAIKPDLLTVTLGRRAVGAGGCCASGGTYSSVDGRNWKKR